MTVVVAAPAAAFFTVDGGEELLTFGLVVYEP